MPVTFIPQRSWERILFTGAVAFLISLSSGEVSAAGINRDADAISAKTSAPSGVCLIVEGIHDAIEPGKNGRLIHWDSIENFATNIVNLLKSPEELAAAGERACEYALTNFSWDIIARRYLSEFQAVAGQGNTKR